MKNHSIQGMNADILKSALALLYRELPIGVYVVLAVHDEIVLECPDKLIEEAARGLRDAMVCACQEEYHQFMHLIKHWCCLIQAHFRRLL